MENQDKELIENDLYNHVLPKEMALAKLCEFTNYPMLQENGQRRYGPPPDWVGPPPKKGCEIFIGKIPRNCYEDELVPIFEKVGKIYMFRLMMDFSGFNRGYAFCLYNTTEASHVAVQKLNNFPIRNGKYLGVCLSIDNCRLFIGGIPKDKSREDILEEMQKITEGVSDVIVCPGISGSRKNRGFALVEYLTHKEAAMARRKLLPGRVLLWNHQISVNWAEPEKQPNHSSNPKSRVISIKNVIQSNEETLRHFIDETISSFYRMKHELPQFKFPSPNTNNNHFTTPPPFKAIQSHPPPLSKFPPQQPSLMPISYVNKCMRINETTYQVTLFRGEDYDLVIRLLNDTVFNGAKLILGYESSFEMMTASIYEKALCDYPTQLNGQHDRSKQDFEASLARLNQKLVSCNQCNRQVNNADSALMLNESVQDLTNFCIDNKLGQPIFNININLWTSKMTGLKVPLYSVQIYIPRLNKTFQNSHLMENFDEAVTLASSQILTWICSNYFKIDLQQQQTFSQNSNIMMNRTLLNC